MNDDIQIIKVHQIISPEIIFERCNDGIYKQKKYIES